MKRQTKAQREEAQYVALRQRVADIAIGAAGYDFDDPAEFATAGLLSRLVPALECVFGNDGNKVLWSASNLDHFETIDGITEWLWDYKVRA